MQNEQYLLAVAVPMDLRDGLGLNAALDVKTVAVAADEMLQNAPVLQFDQGHVCRGGHS
jgi:hypothetical protein